MSLNDTVVNVNVSAHIKRTLDKELGTEALMHGSCLMGLRSVTCFPHISYSQGNLHPQYSTAVTRYFASWFTFQLHRKYDTLCQACLHIKSNLGPLHKHERMPQVLAPQPTEMQTDNF